MKHQTAAREVREMKNRIAMDYSLAMAIGKDAGNVSMLLGRRSAWNDQDWNAACAAVKSVVRWLPLDQRVRTLHSRSTAWR